MRKEISLGKEVYLTDPCYNTTTWCQHLLKKVKEGKWIIDYDYDEFEDGMEQRVILTLAHEDYGFGILEGGYDRKEDSYVLGVDSGTIGVFDKEYYEKYHFATNIDCDWFDKHICNNTHLRRGVNITNGKGVWIDTSFGDGEFDAQLYIKNEEVVGIEIVC